MSKKTYRSDKPADDQGILDSPEAVLNAGAEVLGALDVDHHDGHEHEEESGDEADSEGKTILSKMLDPARFRIQTMSFTNLYTDK